MNTLTHATDREYLRTFLRESLRIEGILRPASGHELEATEIFLCLERLTVSRVKALVEVYAPGKPIRDKAGMDVRVGSHVPQGGGEDIPRYLKVILDRINDTVSNPYEAHQQYEHLHPFMDGNGRSGRTIWLWHMQRDHGRRAAPLGFLHHWYYQSLAHAPEMNLAGRV